MMARYSQFASRYLPSNLRSKLVVFTTLILVLACTTLGWLVVDQQVNAITTGLLQSGGLLAHHLAMASDQAVVEGDRQQLDRITQGALAVDEVDYVIVRGIHGELILSHQKTGWSEQLYRNSAQGFSTLSNIVTPRVIGVASSEAVVTPIHFDPSGPIMAASVLLSFHDLATLLFQSHVSLFYDITVPIKPNNPALSDDSSLQLTLDERIEDGGQQRTEGEPPWHGFVEIGLSTAHMQDHIRSLMTYVLLIMTMIITTSLSVLTLIVKRMTTPLEALTGAARQIAAGTYSFHLPKAQNDEIGVLCQAFDAMTRSLTAHQRDLMELNRHLEERIQQRTEALETANTKLRELDQRKSLFVSTASHELRTPLTAMKVHLENLRYGIDGRLNDAQRAAINLVESKLDRLQQQLEDMLDLSRMELGQITIKPVMLALKPALSEIVESFQLLAARQHITLLTHLPDTLPRVYTDPDKLRQVCLNLLHNALKFTPANGNIVVSAHALLPDEVEIAIHDSGCGIPPGELDKIFLPFYRSSSLSLRSRGAGLGLAIAKHLVELLHGQLGVSSVEGEGSRFAFSLPTRSSVEAA